MTHTAKVKRNVGFHLSITKFAVDRWVIRRGKSTWWFTLPADNDAFRNQIFALVGYAQKLEMQRESA
jgi:hypothetical protein